MAWQLIYTSAPRLLEAGRTGFGTVARHRAVSGMLASSVERFSQFARLPGHDPRRVVHTCRILTVGASTYHVLSCLQDAGSDYTGRTNHIAHHLIAEPREIRTLAAMGLTPADVLLGMSWRTSWSEGPRFLDAAEEIDLGSFASRSSHAWSAVTGNPAQAGLLWSREALKGCYLITPPEANVLELFRESLLAAPAQAWQTRFTTCLEPNDDLADFRWVGISSSSPMRTQVENSNRLVLDLTRPSSLPPPPEVEAPAAASEAPTQAASVPSPPPMPSAVQAQMHLPTAGPAPASSMGGWTPDTRQRAPRKGRSYIALSLVIAALLIAAVGGGLLWQFQQQQEKNQTREAYAQAIAKLWKDDGLLLDDTRKFLEDQPVAEGKPLLKSHEEFFRSMKQVLEHPGASSPALPTDNKDDLKKLKELLDEWNALHVTPWAKLQAEKDTATAATLFEAGRKWEIAREATWKKLTGFLDLKAPPTPSDDLLQPLKILAKAALRREEPPREARTIWGDLFDLLARQKNPMDAETHRWLALWKELEGPASRAAVDTSLADNTLPPWLLAKAAEVKQRHEKDSSKMAETKTDNAEKPKETEKPKALMDDADAVPAKHDIHVLLIKAGEDPISKVTGLKVAADMLLYVGEGGDAHPSPDGKTESKSGELKQWMNIKREGKEEISFGPSRFSSLQEMILISKEGNLLALPEKLHGAANGLRLVARDKDGVHILFDLRLIPLSNVVAKPLFAKEVPASADNGAAATLRLPEGFLPRLHLLGLTNLVFSLRLDGTASEQKIYELKPPVDSSFEVIAPQTGSAASVSLLQIRAKIAELEKGIAKDDADLASIDPKSPPRIQEEKRASYTKGRNEKEIELQTWRTKLQGLEAQKPIHFDLMPGHYTLLLEQPSKIELCKLNVTAATKSPPP